MLQKIFKTRDWMGKGLANKHVDEYPPTIGKAGC